MVKRRRHLLAFGRQGEPDLNAVYRNLAGPDVGRHPFRMDDAAPGRHQVDRAGLDALDVAQAVAVDQRAGIEIGHGGQADVRMRAHVAGRPFAGELRRSHVIEEDEGTDRRNLGRRQESLDRKTDIAGCRG